jgi:hypothetical protein
MEMQYQISRAMRSPAVRPRLRRHFESSRVSHVMSLARHSYLFPKIEEALMRRPRARPLLDLGSMNRSGSRRIRRGRLCRSRETRWTVSVRCRVRRGGIISYVVRRYPDQVAVVFTLSGDPIVS